MGVRRLTTDDVEAYRRVRLAALDDAPHAFGSTYDREMGLSEPDWRRRLEDESRAVFVAEEGGGILGLSVAAPDDGDERAGYLLSMWVDPAARGRGLGDALVQEVVRWLTRAGYDRVRLDVTEGNDAALELYRRNGFVLTGRQFRRERDGVVELEMQRSTSAPVPSPGP